MIGWMMRSAGQKEDLDVEADASPFRATTPDPDCGAFFRLPGPFTHVDVAGGHWGDGVCDVAPASGPG